MSTTEAELVALAQCAIEMIYIISLLKFIGYVCKGDVMVETDNTGAYELCHKYTSAQHTRHIDRKLFKLREMRGSGIVKVQYIPPPAERAASNFLRWRLATCDSGCAGPGAFGSSSFGRDPEDVPWSSSSAMPNPRAIVRVATPAPRPQCAEARRSGLSSC